MSESEAFIHALTRGPAHELVALLAAAPRQVNTFLAQPAPHGPEQWMPLHHAAEAGYLDGVETLLDRGAHPDCRTRFTTPMHARQTPLHLAAAGGHDAVIRRLLEAGTEVEVRDAQQRSPLWAAARHGHAVVVTQLARRGASLEARDTQQRTPLHAALLPAKPGAERSEVPDRFTISNDIVDEALPFQPAPALALLDAGADPNATCPKEPEGFTPLHRCVVLREVALPVARALLQKNADRSAADPRHGRTPLALARHLDQSAYVDILSQ